MTVNFVSDIAVVCCGTKRKPHKSTHVALLGWNRQAKRQEHKFLAYAGPTPNYGRSRPVLWQPGRPVNDDDWVLRFKCPHQDCARDEPVKVKRLEQMAVALEGLGADEEGVHITLNLSALPRIAP